MVALSHYLAMQGNVVAQLVDSAQANHEMVNSRDEEIVELNAHINQLEGQVEDMGERNNEIALSEQQLNALQIQLDNALELIDVQQAQQAQPAAMEVEDEEDPEEIQDVSGVDTVSGVPMPPPHGAHSLVQSVNNLDDF
jgi:type II secretory pathway component PulJ